MISQSEITGIAPDGQINVRRTDIVMDGDVEVSRSVHRHVLVPGDVLDNEDSAVANKAREVWVPQIVTAWQTKMAAERTVRERVPTVQELSERDDTIIAASFNAPGIVRALATLLFQLTNDVRVLKGQGAITVAQFKTALKAQIRG